MPSIGSRCHELRVTDQGVAWRIMYQVDPDAIIILEVFSKKTGHTPQEVITICIQRLRAYDS